MSELFSSGALGVLIKGGIFMWPILALAVVAIAVIIERWRGLRMLDADDESLKSEVIELLAKDDVESALDKCDHARGPVAAVLSHGLRKFLVLRRLNYDPARIEEGVIKSMEGSGSHIVAALERHLPILATVSSVAPMLGFLGTVQGMIVSFGELLNLDGRNIIEAAAAGIQTALLTTCFGLMVGIPAYLFFNYFTSVINRFVLDVESSAADLIEAVTLQMTLAQGARK